MDAPALTLRGCRIWSHLERIAAMQQAPSTHGQSMAAIDELLAEMAETFPGRDVITLGSAALSRGRAELGRILAQTRERRQCDETAPSAFQRPDGYCRQRVDMARCAACLASVGGELRCLSF